MHGSFSVDALQKKKKKKKKKEAEESACGKVHDPALKITEIYFQKRKLLIFLGLILEVTRRSLMQREFHIRNYMNM